MRIAVLDDYQGVALAMADWSRVLARADVDVFRDHVADPAALTTRLAPYDGVVLMRERTALPASVIEALPNLKLVVTTGRRNPAIDLEALSGRGVVVCNTESPANSTSELTWALILGLSRHLVEEVTSVREGGWQTTLGSDLAGRTLGIVGLGRIGAQVATVGRAFGMTVLAWSRSLTPERAAQVGATAVSLDDVLSGSDIVTVHVVLSDSTRGLLGQRELALMRPGALLVNTSRGPIVDTVALVRGLDTGRLGGAALDVFEEEPLPPDHPLRTAPRALITPHIGYVTEGVYRVFFEQAVEDIEAFLDGAPIRTVDPA
ncbi:MAG: D-2-hydroxyacid dehydrogenase family protein [Nocardioidaceae bacterium]